MLVTKPYQNERAVEYARRWALSRNPLFVDFTGRGGNCTNFVSQSILAGSCVMNLTPDFGWYYISDSDRAPAWSSVEYFYDFMTGVPAFASRNGGIGPYAREVMRREAVPGDVIQYADAEGDWYHTVIISKIENGEIYVCAQSDDALDRPLSSYRFAMARFLHIEGVRFEVENDGCFDYLISGGAEPPAVPEEPPLPELPEEQPPQISPPEPSGPQPSETPTPETPAPESPQEPAQETPQAEETPSLPDSGALPLNDRPEVIEGS